VYARIADDASGELLITSNARRGEVLIDGLPVTELFEGHATVSNLALGTHELVIRASGYHAFDVDVTVDGRTQESVLLDPL
jgi:PEGA domain-containing protein